MTNTTDTPRTDAMPKRYMTVVYEITDETEWRKTNPLRYAHNGLNAVRVSIDDAIELLDEAEAEVERLKEEYEAAAESVARMHEAAVGEIRGPSISVLEDIKAVRERAEKAEAKANKLESSLRRIIDAPVFDPAKLIDFSMKLLWDSIAEAKATLNQDNK